MGLLGDHEHVHHGPGSGRKGAAPFVIGVIITLVFATVEFIFGWIAGSLALMGDAVHMASDSFALGLAAFAAWLARRPVTERHSFGLGRAEVLAAMINATVLLVIVGALALAAIQRLIEPRPVEGGIVLVVGSIGLMLNIILAIVLFRGERTLNNRGALLHVLGDLMGSVAVITAGTVVMLTGWTPIDPLLTLFICALVTVAALRLLRDAGNVVLEAVPRHLDLVEVGQGMAGLEGVDSVHDLHIWSLSSDVVALSAHIMVTDMKGWETIRLRLAAHLRDNYGIEHVTLQPEPAILGATPLGRLKKISE
jgi:cobalt-zinc-cadmium efflux system protein